MKVPTILPHPSEIAPQALMHLDKFALSEKSKIYMIRWRGKLVKTPSGKSVWKSQGAARSSFNRWVKNYHFRLEWFKDFPEQHSKIDNIYYISITNTSDFRKFVDACIQHKILEFVCVNSNEENKV